ncbi:YihY/virulence factor BrkB family protein [Melioribacteraceae bacterium 4301-Me]|uniref:YihY/virulence factor BrkB family protein n=1 Tax=Pyranulibacter aquaticus TaxID=3163344 RepID=UPI003595344C
MYRIKIIRKITSFISVKTLRNFINFFKSYFPVLFKRMDEHHIFLSGGGIAFSLLLSFIPLVLVVLSLVGNFFSQTAIESALKQIIEAAIPSRATANFVEKVVISRLPEVIEYRTLAGYIGFIGLMFTSTWLFSSMRTILNRIFNVSQQKSAIIGLLRDIGMVLLLVVFVALSTFILPTFNVIMDSAEKVEFLRAFRFTEIIDLSIKLISLLVLFFMFFLFYYIIPYEKLGKKVPLIAAFWTTTFWEIARWIFGYYVKHFLSTNNIYGAFIFIVVVLFWIFYSSCLFIVGAEIGQLYRERLSEKLLINDNKK